MKQFSANSPGNFSYNGLPFIPSPFVINFKFFDMKKTILLLFSLYSFAVLKAQITTVEKPGSGNGIQLTGTGSLATSPHINIGSGFDFGTLPFTYETWIKRDVISTTAGNLGKTFIVGNNNNAWGIGIVNDNTLFFTKVNVNGAFSSGTIADTKWHHVAVVYTGTQIQFYIDGVAAGNTSYTDNFSNTAGDYIIGPHLLCHLMY